MKPTIIHLIGPPGVGKYTIGKEVARLAGARLVDNHAIANVIFNLIEVDGVTPLPREVWTYVGGVRRAVLDAILNLSPRHLSFVFTNFIRGDDPAEYAVFEEFVAVAEVRGSLYVPVALSCETPELLTRIVRQDRAERMKLVDPVLGRKFNEEAAPFVTLHPNFLRVDVTAIPPDESARRIIEWAESRATRA
jgi:hypothetical protein